jgi:DNA-directed RNA polymerase subunit M/transcription elongation factor TFIIS
MNFCPECENYMPLKVEDPESENKKKMLKYECNNCGYSKYMDTDKESLVHSNRYEQNKFKLDNMDFENVSQDPTLPRVNNLQCPFKECPSNESSKTSDILFIGIDESTATFMYKCNNCNKTWVNK